MMQSVNVNISTNYFQVAATVYKYFRQMSVFYFQHPPFLPPNLNLIISCYLSRFIYLGSPTVMITGIALFFGYISCNVKSAPKQPMASQSRLSTLYFSTTPLMYLASQPNSCLECFKAVLVVVPRYGSFPLTFTSIYFSSHAGFTL